MDTKDASEISERLLRAYPSAKCELCFSTVFELLIAVILSAQCTDKRVNQVCQSLFKVADTPEQFAAMQPEKLEKLIYSCGFYKNKAKSIIESSRDLVERFDSKVPDNLEDLMTLKGVGRKTANVVLSVAFGKNAIAVDTHVFRVSRRLGLSNGKNPHEVEKDLTALFEKNLNTVHHLLIFHGRYCCHSRNPDCENCTVKSMCARILKV